MYLIGSILTNCCYRYDDFCVMKIEYIMYNVHDFSVLHNNAALPFICEGLYFIHM